MARKLSRMAILALTVALLLGVFAGPSTAEAADFRSGSQPGVPAGQTVDDDVYIFGGTATVDGTVRRDLTIGAGTITVAGEVGGNLNVSGGTVTVSGPVRGSIRVAGGTITISGPVGWDVVATGGTIHLDSNARVSHDVVLAGGTATIDGEVGRDIRGSVGNLTLNNHVGRDVRVNVGDQLRLNSRTRIDGNLDYRSDQNAEMAQGATVAGTTTHRQPPSRNPVSRVVAWIVGLLLRLVWALIVGTVLVLLLPRPAAGVADTLRERPLVSLGWGVAVLIVVPIVAIILMITVIGLPVGLILLGCYIAALYLSQVIVGLTIGRLIFSRSWGDAGRLHLWVSMLIGTIIVVVIRLLPIPYGWTYWVSLIVSFLGLGAVWTYFTGWGRHPMPYQPRPTEPLEPPEPLPPPVE